jgi:hypothetical protein
MKNLMIGLCVGYPLATLKPFLATWREMPGVDLCLCVADLDLETVRVLEGLGVVLRDAKPHMRSNLHMQSARYYMYRQILNDIGDQYKKILLTDVADVYFQSDPFQELPDAELVFTEEPLLIRHSKTNRDWVGSVGGPAVRNALLDCPILCGGTTFGTPKGISNYVDRMILMLADPRNQVPTVGIDQAFHIMTAVLDPPPGSVIVPNSAPVATMNYMRQGDVELIGDKLHDKVTGRFPALVHQWNRKPAVADYVRKRFQDVTFETPGEATSRFTFDILAYCGGDWTDETQDNASMFLRSLESNGFSGRVFWSGPQACTRDVGLDFQRPSDGTNAGPVEFLRTSLSRLAEKVLVCRADNTVLQFTPEDFPLENSFECACRGPRFSRNQALFTRVAGLIGVEVAEFALGFNLPSTSFFRAKRDGIGAIVELADQLTTIDPSSADNPDEMLETVLMARCALTRTPSPMFPFRQAVDLQDFHPQSCTIDEYLEVLSVTPTALLNWKSVDAARDFVQAGMTKAEREE